MAVTTDQYNRLLARLTKLETTVNDIMVAMNRLVSLGEVQQLLTVLQTDLDDITTRLDSLEDRIETIEEEPLA